MQAQLQVEGPDLPTWDPQPLAPQSAYLFPHATGFDINGGQFVSGDVHNHMVTPRSLARSSVRRSLTLPAPVTSATDREPTPLPCLDPASDLLSESEFYCSQLLRKKRGFPLYVPGPPRNLPEEYRRRGVAIGDVGRVTPEGVFDFFFNIYLPSDHPINANVPDDFSPLSPYASVDVVPLDHDPGNCVLTPTVNNQELDLDTPSDDFPGGEFHFACSGPKGAVLALPYGSHLDKLENLESVRRYVANHAESWYKYVNGARGRGLSNGSLYLVTGCEKSSSGGMASYQNAAAENEFQLSFKPTADADSGYKHRWSRGRACTKYFSGPPPVDGSPLNQTVFIHGYKIGLGTGIWGAIFGTVDICELADSRVGEGRGDFVAHHAQSSLFSWSSGCLGSGTTSGTKHYAGPGGGDVFMTDSSPASKIFHPSEIINEYLLREAPQVAVVMTHDDDWCDILQDDGPGPAVHSSSEFLLQISRKFNLREEDGAGFLVAKSEAATEDHMSTEMLWDETVQPVETDHSPKLATSWTAQNHAVPIVNPFLPANPSLEPVLYYEEFGPAAPRQDSPSIPVFEWDNTPSYYSSPAQSDVSLYSGPTASSRSSSSDFGFDVAGSSRRPSWDTSSPHSPAGALLHGHDLPDSDLPSWGDYTIPEDLCKPQGPPEPPATRSPRLRGKLATYPCHFCSANFTSKHNLNNHINSHLGLRQHSCKKCSRTFITESVKRRHEIKCSHEQTPTVYGNRDGTASSSTDLAVIPDASDVGTPKQDTAETGTGAVRSSSLTHRSSDLYAETSRTP